MFVKYCGVDINQICVDTATRHRKNGIFIHADIEDLSLLDTEKFDICVFDKTLELLHNPKDVLIKLLNISKFVIICYPTHDENGVEAINKPMRWNGMCEDSPLWKFTFKFFSNIGSSINNFPFVIIKPKIETKPDKKQYKKEKYLEQ